MKTQRNMLVAFLLNLFFSIFEFVGGMLCSSHAIMSDALHDAGDALGIGISLILEKKSNKIPDENYTYGYRRLSVVGALFTSTVLLCGSALIIVNAIKKIVNPSPVEYGEMIVFAVIGTSVNLICTFITRKGHSLNQKAVNLHMLEDVLGWAVVLVGAVIMYFTDLSVIDPLLSAGVSLFIMYHAIRNIKDVLGIFLEKAPDGIKVSEIKDHLLKIHGVADVHHIHLWSLDEGENYATMHVVTDECAADIKEKVREELKKHGILHVTLEIESQDENCHDMICFPIHENTHSHKHSHHHCHKNASK